MPGCKRTPGVVHIYADHEAVSLAAAELFMRLSNEAIRERGWFRVVLSGGHTPIRAYQLLAGRHFSDRIDWTRVHVFWGDERCVPLEDSRSNAGTAYRQLFDHIPIPGSQIHPILCAESPQEAVSGYESLLQSIFEEGQSRPDLVLLGLGPDGHTASLLPGTSALKERHRWAAEVVSREEGIHRVTLTAPFINTARVIAFIVSGESKAGILRKVLCEKPEHIPAHLIKPGRGGELWWLLDREAASLLDSCTEQPAAA